jgi:choline dehydrogenase-like flavoprotein
LPYFRKSECHEQGASDYHGVDHFNRGDNEGVGLYEVTQFHDKDRNGERCSAAAYLHPLMGQRNYLKVVTGAHASRCFLSTAGLYFLQELIREYEQG